VPAAEVTPASDPRPGLAGPWWSWTIAAVSVAIQAIPALRNELVYDRSDIQTGEWWRIWTGHLVHFGWPHLVVDAGLLAILGWYGERRYPWFSRVGMVLMPAFISAMIFWFEPTMERYGGLSAFNLGLLLYVALQGWQRDWTDWFWPAVLAIYVGELVFEHFHGGQGGGAIRFDDSSVRVATGAHVASAVYAAFVIGGARLWSRRPSGRPA
jgi:rhomboid family GlyGly-CTERM serine protease